jgi:hypothetical protein
MDVWVDLDMHCSQFVSWFVNGEDGPNQTPNPSPPNSVTNHHHHYDHSLHAPPPHPLPNSPPHFHFSLLWQSKLSHGRWNPLRVNYSMGIIQKQKAPLLDMGKGE